MTASTQPQPQPGPHGKWFARVYVPVLALAGGVGGWILADSIDHQSVASDFWSQILTIVGLSALPIVVVAMRVPAYATPRWRAIAAVAVLAAFAIVLVVFAIAMHQVAQVVPEGEPPPQPSDASLYVACIGTGLILAAVACGVVIAFFEPFGSMEPRS
jgi:asparagine N-glycosylation enzyme membrane subunit Stt3